MKLWRWIVVLIGYGPAVGLVNVALLLALPAAADSVSVLAFGDSLTAGYGLARPDSFPAQLERALTAEGYKVEVINAGVSGDTTAGGRARLDWVLAAVKPADTIVSIVELGANDALRGLDPVATEANLDAIVGRLKEAGVGVLLAGMKAPPNLGREYGTEFDGLYPRLAERHGVALYPFFLDGVAARPSLNLDDGKHPNTEGVAVIVKRILPHVRALLAGAE
jgi:acyl-CoA thioesterase I